MFKVTSDLHSLLRGRTRFMHDPIAKAAEMYQSGLSLTLVSKELGVSYSTIRTRLRRDGVAIRSKGPRKWGRGPTKDVPPKAEWSPIVRMFANGRSGPYIARELGIKLRGVFYVLNELGIERRISSGGAD